MNTIRSTLTRLQRRVFARGGERPEPPQEPGEELAWADGLFFGRVPLQRWNPDELVWRRGYAVYRRMLQDDQVRAVVALRRHLVTARPWHFVIDEADGRQRACRDFLAHMLGTALRGTFRQALADVLTSQVFGFSLVEKVYGEVGWQGRTLWGVRRLKLRPPETFTFEADRHGNRTGILQQQGAAEARLPAERFIHHVNKPEADPHYGESDLRECHRHWWAKDNILKFWNIYLERMAAGFVHGRVNGPLSGAEREELKQVLQNLSTQTSVITPGSVELEMVTAPSTDAFERAVAARDKAIARALLLPSLLGYSEQGAVGSYAQSRTQLETFLLVAGAVAEGLADTLNEQLFAELAWWNFGLAEPPRFTFDPLSGEQKLQAARAWQQAVQAGTVTHTAADEAQLRSLLGFGPGAGSGSPATAGGTTGGTTP